MCLGSNMEQALKNAELLERVAQIYYHALTTVIEITRLPESSVQKLIEMRKLKFGIIIEEDPGNEAG